MFVLYIYRGSQNSCFLSMQFGFGYGVNSFSHVVTAHFVNSTRHYFLIYF